MAGTVVAQGISQKVLEMVLEIPGFSEDFGIDEEMKKAIDQADGTIEETLNCVDEIIGNQLKKQGNCEMEIRKRLESVVQDLESLLNPGQIEEKPRENGFFTEITNVCLDRGDIYKVSIENKGGNPFPGGTLSLNTSKLNLPMATVPVLYAKQEKILKIKIPAITMLEQGKLSFSLVSNGEIHSEFTFYSIFIEKIHVFSDDTFTIQVKNNTSIAISGQIVLITENHATSLKSVVFPCASTQIHECQNVAPGIFSIWRMDKYISNQYKY